jgi:glycosyltransferase involved in cell wall biosynthesis
VSEVLTDNLTGFIVDSVDEAAEAVERASSLSRDRIRREFDRRFTAQRMASDYLSVYERVLGRGAGRGAAQHVHND